MMRKIDILYAEIDSKPIPKGLLLSVNTGEMYAIMGPNGAKGRSAP